MPEEMISSIPNPSFNDGNWESARWSVFPLKFCNCKKNEKRSRNKREEKVKIMTSCLVWAKSDITVWSLSFILRERCWRGLRVNTEKEEKKWNRKKFKSPFGEYCFSPKGVIYRFILYDIKIIIRWITWWIQSFIDVKLMETLKSRFFYSTFYMDLSQGNDGVENIDTCARDEIRSHAYYAEIIAYHACARAIAHFSPHHWMHHLTSRGRAY